VSGYRQFGHGHRGQHFRPIQSGGNSWGQGGWGTAQTQDSSDGSSVSCPRPSFTDAAELMIDNCHNGFRQGFNPVCRNAETKQVFILLNLLTCIMSHLNTIKS